MQHGGCKSPVLTTGNNFDAYGAKPFGHLTGTIIRHSSWLNTSNVQKTKSYIVLKHGIMLNMAGTGAGNWLLLDSTTDGMPAYIRYIIKKQAYWQRYSIRIAAKTIPQHSSRCAIYKEKIKAVFNTLKRIILMLTILITKKHV